jgi:hypothetical protein
MFAVKARRTIVAKSRVLRTAALAAFFVLIPAALAPAAPAQYSDSSAKQDINDAGHSTKEAAKKTGSATKKESKKIVHKTAKATDKGAKKVEDKTASTPRAQ